MGLVLDREEDTADHTQEIHTCVQCLIIVNIEEIILHSFFQHEEEIGIQKATQTTCVWDSGAYVWGEGGAQASVDL